MPCHPYGGLCKRNGPRRPTFNERPHKGAHSTWLQGAPGKGCRSHHLGVLVKSLTPLSKGLLVAAREEDEPREALCHSAWTASCRGYVADYFDAFLCLCETAPCCEKAWSGRRRRRRRTTTEVCMIGGRQEDNGIVTSEQEDNGNVTSEQEDVARSVYLTFPLAICWCMFASKYEEA